MQTSLVQNRDEKKRARMSDSIERKQKILEDLMEKIETLRVELDVIKHEYNVRIGGLLLKDNQLDLEILQLKNLQDLIKGGMTLEEAQQYEEDAFYNDMLRMQQEQEKINEEKKMLDEIQDVSEDVMEEIKTIWKKLIRQFHPDLVTDPKEKEKREELMKKINKAYTERNIEALKQFESTKSVIPLPDLSLKELEENLVKIENAIKDAQGEWNILQKSTWYEWKKKKEKTQDIFKELEQTFLDDIVKKIEIVQRLRSEVHQ